MPLSARSSAFGVLAITIGLVAWTAADSSEVEQVTTSPVARTSDSVAARTPLILAKEQGERRIRRVMGGALAIIKVDRRNGGSPGLVMGYEEIPPGQAIQAHRHPAMDEIISCIPARVPPNSVSEPQPSGRARRYTSLKRLV